MELAAQFNLLAQGPNFEDWGDFLVIAIMAALWLVGALAKAIGGRKGTQPAQPQQDSAKQRRPRETWQERLAHKVEEMQRAAEGRPTRQSSQPRPHPASHPPVGKIKVRTRPKGDSVIVFERPSTGGTAEREQAIRQGEARRAVTAAGQRITRPPAVEPRIETPRPASEPLIDSMVGTLQEPPRPLEPSGVPSEAMRQSAGLQPTAIIDYSDPDALMKAILHYEILSKPLALRDPSE